MNARNPHLTAHHRSYRSPTSHRSQRSQRHATPFARACDPPPTARRTPVRRGLSLLEVILAIAILGGSIAVVGELVRLGVRNAEEARELTTGQLLCESKLEEIAAGIAPAEAASNAACESDPRWTYSVMVTPLDQESLIEVRVTVQQAESNRLYPLTCTLVRWMLDPSITSSETGEESTTGEESQASGQSGSTGQSTTGGQTGSSGGGNGG